jgi:protein-tyrosine phosphatase
LLFDLFFHFKTKALLTCITLYRIVNFMKDKGVTNVIVLLDENEFDIYDYPGLLNIYEQQGIRFLRQSMDEANASKKIYSFVNNVKNMGGKVVTHCTGGIGRCGRVAAGWLVCEYGLSPEQATMETLEQAKVSGVTRAGDAKKLQAWLS